MGEGGDSILPRVVIGRERPPCVRWRHLAEAAPAEQSSIPQQFGECHLHPLWHTTVAALHACVCLALVLLANAADTSTHDPPPPCCPPHVTHLRGVPTVWQARQPSMMCLHHDFAHLTVLALGHSLAPWPFVMHGALGLPHVQPSNHRLCFERIHSVRQEYVHAMHHFCRVGVSSARMRSARCRSRGTPMRSTCAHIT